MAKGKATMELRRRAEARLNRRTTKRPRQLSNMDARRLVHELEVHRIELEMQNDELRASRLETETGLERYTALFDFAPTGYAILNLNQRIRQVNHLGSHILGRARGELVGRHFSSLIASQDRKIFDALIGNTLNTLDGEMSPAAEVNLHRSGNLRVLRLIARQFMRDRVILLAFEDITEQKDKERKLRTTESALREADRRKDQFLAVLSHELRNPLAPIRHSLFVLSQSEPGSDQARKAQTIIDHQIAHLTRLIDDLLDINRIGKGKIQLQRAWVDLEELVRRTLDDYRDAFAANGIRLEGSFENGPYWLNGDPARLTQALTNLLHNAEKLTLPHGVVEVTLRRKRGSAELRVSDSGPGIPPDVLLHIFEPFAQAPQPMDRPRGGLGLGLAMAKGLIELHGGTIAVASELGHGAEIKITLPLESVQSERAPSPSPPRPLQRRRVLVIEDNVDAADSLRTALELIGHEAQVAYEGKAGVQLARTFHPEIVLCDIGLPKMDGYEVARAFRRDANLRETFLVALSGYSQLEDRQKTAAAGFNQHVSKPATIDTIERILADAPSAANPSAAVH